MAMTISGTDGVTFPNASTQTVASTPPTAGNGISVTSGTVAVACPSYNSVGSYCWISTTIPQYNQVNSGQNYAAGGGNMQIQSSIVSYSEGANIVSNGLSGTWKWMGASVYSFNDPYPSVGAVGCRVS